MKKEESPIRIAKENEVYGIVDSWYGKDRVIVICDDGVNRICRISGRVIKKFWLKVGDVVLVRIWPFDKSKGDVIHVYTFSEAQWLKKNGYIKNLNF